MLRVIAGNLKGKKLKTVSGQHTRPTSDRLRESLFNIISDDIQGAFVLDLFAGTGALGIEALSRGAQTAVFVDNYKPSLSIIEANIKSCRMTAAARIINWNIINNLNCLRSKKPLFNIVFMDPPYDEDAIEKSLSNLHESGSLFKEAKIIVEHSIKEMIPENEVFFKTIDNRKYGKTIVSFLSYVI